MVKNSNESYHGELEKANGKSVFTKKDFERLNIEILYVGYIIFNMNTLKQGQSVLVTDYQGIKHLRKVWEDAGKVILITSESNFRALKKGMSHIWPIGVPRGTVEAPTSV